MTVAWHYNMNLRPDNYLASLMWWAIIRKQSDENVLIRSWGPPALSSKNCLVSELFFNPKQLYQKSNIQYR